MEERKTVFDYIGQIFGIFGMTITILNVFSQLFGAEAKGYSAMFSLGAEGLSFPVMMQFLLVSALVVVERYLFFTDAIIKRLSMPLRTAGMVITVLLSIGVCIVAFDWFPVDFWQAWAMFFLCFGVCFCLSVAIMSLRERAENRKMEKALERLKRESKN